MVDLVIILIPILIADIINPVLFAGAVYTLGSQHPYRNTLWMLFGFFSTYFLCGILMGVVLEQVLEYLKTPSTFDYAAAIAIAIFLVVFSWNLLKHKGEEHDAHLKRPAVMTGFRSFWLGLQINIIGLPFALPYFAAIDQILMEDFHPLIGTFVLLVYNLLYIAPFAAMMIVRKLYEKKSDAIFAWFNHILWKLCDVLLPFFLIGIACYLLYEGIYYFFFNLTGE